MKQQKLEEQQWNIEMELRHLMNKPGEDKLHRDFCWSLAVQRPTLCAPAPRCPSDAVCLPGIMVSLGNSPDSAARCFLRDVRCTPECEDNQIQACERDLLEQREGSTPVGRY